MTAVITLQLLYCLAGAGMNIGSILRLRTGRNGLTPNNPWIGLRTMGLAALITLSPLVGLGAVYLLGWGYLSQRITRRGLSPHIRAFTTGEGLDRYGTKWAASLAATINFSGVALAVVGLSIHVANWLSRV